MQRKIPYRGRHVDEMMLPAGFRRRYVLLLAWAHYWLLGQLDKHVAKCVMQDPLGMFSRKSNLGSGVASNSAPLSGLKASDKDKIMELRGSMEAKRRGYQEGRANQDTATPHVYNSATAPEKADQAMSDLLATHLVQDRSSRYGKGRGKFVVCEDDVFSPIDDQPVEEPQGVTQ